MVSLRHRFHLRYLPAMILINLTTSLSLSLSMELTICLSANGFFASLALVSQSEEKKAQNVVREWQ